MSQVYLVDFTLRSQTSFILSMVIHARKFIIPSLSTDYMNRLFWKKSDQRGNVSQNLPNMIRSFQSHILFNKITPHSPFSRKFYANLENIFSRARNSKTVIRVPLILLIQNINIKSFFPSQKNIHRIKKIKSKHISLKLLKKMKYHFEILLSFFPLSRFSRTADVYFENLTDPVMQLLYVYFVQEVKK